MLKALFAATALLSAAAASADELSIDSKKEAVYNCTAQGQNFKINAMYGIKNGKIVVAQLKVGDNISPGLFPVADRLLNRFVSAGADGTMWTTLPADGNNITQVDGGKLSVRQDNTNSIVLENCKLDKAATAQLNR